MYTSSWEFYSSIKGLDVAKSWEEIVLRGTKLKYLKMKTKLNLEPWGNFARISNEIALSSSATPDTDYGIYYISLK